jgi:ABC-2 type transport system permease protein
MNIFLRELKSNLKSLLIWSVIIVLLVVVGMAKFSAYYNNPSALEILNSFPKSVLDAMSLKAFNLTTLSGLFGLMFIYYALLGGIAAAMWGSDSVSKEERDKTVEFSLVLPVTRSRVITAKALAALVNCVVFVLVTWVTSLAVARPYNPDQAFFSFLRLQMVAMFIIELIFLALGILLGCVMKQYKLSGSTAVTIILATYIISVVTSIDAKLSFLNNFTPFKYFDAGEMLRTGQLNSGYVLLSAGIVVVCLVVAYFSYERRDLYI